jgi:hypothetical protein
VLLQQANMLRKTKQHARKQGVAAAERTQEVDVAVYAAACLDEWSMLKGHVHVLPRPLLRRMRQSHVCSCLRPPGSTAPAAV